MLYIIQLVKVDVIYGVVENLDDKVSLMVLLVEKFVAKPK